MCGKVTADHTRVCTLTGTAVTPTFVALESGLMTRMSAPAFSCVLHAAGAVIEYCPRLPLIMLVSTIPSANALGSALQAHNRFLAA